MPHTPGPWTNYNKKGDIAETYYITSAARNVCLIAGNGRLDEKHGLPKDVEALDAEDEANARLITAAPDLLQALKELLATSQCIDSMNKKFTQVMAYTTAPELHQKCHQAIAKATGTEAFHEDRP